MRYIGFQVTYFGHDLGTCKTPGAAYKRVYVHYRDAIDAGGFEWTGLKIVPVEVEGPQF